MEFSKLEVAVINELTTKELENVKLDKILDNEIDVYHYVLLNELKKKLSVDCCKDVLPLWDHYRADNEETIEKYVGALMKLTNYKG